MRRAILGGFFGALLAIGVLVACGGGSGAVVPALTASFGQFTVPARAFSYDPTSTIISEHVLGLEWTNSLSGTAVVTAPRPPNHAGGDVTLRLLVNKVEAAGTGTVAFILFAHSYDLGEDFGLGTGLTATPVDLTGDPQYTFYEVVFTVPAAAMSKAIWLFEIVRDSGTGTYPNDVAVMGVTAAYTPTP